MTANYERYAEASPYLLEYLLPPIYHDTLAATSGVSGMYIEVGAGDGGKLRSAIDAGLLSRFSTIRAFDISSTRVARMARYVPEAHPEVGDAQCTPLPDGSVGFYYSDQVIEHVPDDSKMARDMHRLLSPGGHGLVGSVVKAKGAWYFYRCNGNWALDPTHVREYPSAEAYAKIFEDAGLEVVRSELIPVAIPVTDIFLRGLLRLRLIGTGTYTHAFKRFPILLRLSHVKVRIPRYFTCHVVVRKPLHEAP